jgi:hypothetical protein
MTFVRFLMGAISPGWKTLTSMKGSTGATSASFEELGSRGRGSCWAEMIWNRAEK